jgi:DNA-binding PadR family transcriptional regulator
MSRPFDAPLSNAVLHILTALAGGQLHGYGIMQEVRRLSSDQYRLGTGTLYSNLGPLLDQGLVEEVSGESDASRREYRLTAEGEALLQRDAKRLESMVRAANRRLGSVAKEGVR